MKKYRTKWFIYGLRAIIRRAMKKVYLTYIDSLQEVVEIESKTYKLEGLKSNISTKIRYLTK